MGRRRSNAASKKGSAAVQAYCEKVSAKLAETHAHHVHHTRVRLAFERLARDYPRLHPVRLWAMAHASLRMVHGTPHADYREQRFVAG